MKSAIVCFLALATLALARPDEGKYTSRWDTIDLQEIIGNKKILTQYVDCCLERGKCTPDAKEMKSKIKDAMENNCAKCTDVQKDGVKTVITHLINHEPGYWEELKAKYDPTGKYAAKYEKEIKAAKQ